MGRSYLNFFKKFQWGSIPGIMPKEYSKVKSKSIIKEVDIIGKLMNNNLKFKSYKKVNTYLEEVPKKIKVNFKKASRTSPYNKSIFIGLILPAVEECINQFQIIQKQIPIEIDDPQIELFISTFKNNKEKMALRKLICSGREIMVERIISLAHDLLFGLDRWMFSPFYTSSKDSDIALVCKKDAKLLQTVQDRTAAEYFSDKPVPLTWKEKGMKLFRRKKNYIKTK